MEAPPSELLQGVQALAARLGRASSTAVKPSVRPPEFSGSLSETSTRIRSVGLARNADGSWVVEVVLLENRVDPRGATAETNGKAAMTPAAALEENAVLALLPLDLRASLVGRVRVVTGASVLTLETKSRTTLEEGAL